MLEARGVVGPPIDYAPGGYGCPTDYNLQSVLIPEIDLNGDGVQCSKDVFGPVASQFAVRTYSTDNDLEEFWPDQGPCVGAEVYPLPAQGSFYTADRNGNGVVCVTAFLLQTGWALGQEHFNTGRTIVSVRDD
jgi:hypothetical protein